MFLMKSLCKLKRPAYVLLLHLCILHLKIAGKVLDQNSNNLFEQSVFEFSFFTLKAIHTIGACQFFWQKVLDDRKTKSITGI